MPKDKEKSAPARSARRTTRGQESRLLRIIGGTWRSRRFRFPPGVEIRPTPDRVRETLFNWLSPRIVGARCLDLFAGSGALGLEALSRGAAEVIFVERSRVAAEGIGEVLAQWGGAGGRVIAMDALKYLALEPRPYDLVFVDPPFASGLVPGVLAALCGGGWLAPDARVYREFAAREAPLALPAKLAILRQGRSGEVGYDLLQVSDGGGGEQQ